MGIYCGWEHTDHPACISDPTASSIFLGTLQSIWLAGDWQQTLLQSELLPSWLQ